MAQRISRAKQTLRARRPLRAAADGGAAGAARAVLQVLYLIFNEGYAASSGDRLQRADLTARRSGWTRWCTRCCPPTARSPGCSR